MTRPARFERKYRLLQGGEFKAVFDRRLRLHCTFFSFHLLDTAGCRSCHRLGLAVSRKVSKRAVQRNRIKRQVRESFRHYQADSGTVHMPGWMDLVVVAKPAAATAENIQLRAELDQAWPRALNMSQNNRGVKKPGPSSRPTRTGS